MQTVKHVLNMEAKESQSYIFLVTLCKYSGKQIMIFMC